MSSVFLATGTELPTFVFRVTYVFITSSLSPTTLSCSGKFFFPLSRCNKYAYFTQNKTYSSGVELLCNTHNPWGTTYVSAKKSHTLKHTTVSEDDIKTNVYSVCLERTRANSPNKYFHIHFSPLHVIHSYQCESINTNTTLTVMCFCFISQLMNGIINDSRCPLVNSPDFI